jgi:XTP/dITP diphosphohydrolase
MQLVIASNNPHKIDEISAIYAGLPLTILSAQRAGLPLDVAETGTTFLENATLKVSAFPDLPQTMYLADDSGLEVAALAGRPGVHSARYGGPGLSDAARSAALLAELGNTADRRAQFVAVCVLRLPNGSLHHARGAVTGTLLHSPSGSGGFGYDPLFVPDGYTESFAALPPAVKNRLSHRGRALAALRPALGECLQTGYTF